MTVAFIPRSLIISSRVTKARTAARTPNSEGESRRASTSIARNVTARAPVKLRSDQKTPLRNEAGFCSFAFMSGPPARVASVPPEDYLVRPRQIRP